MMLFIDFWTRLTQANVMIGIVLAVIGVAMVLMSKRIVKVHKKLEEVPNDDHAVMVIRGFGLVFVLIAMFIMILY